MDCEHNPTLSVAGLCEINGWGKIPGLACLRQNLVGWKSGQILGFLPEKKLKMTIFEVKKPLKK
jgi:hypothetical protein